MTLEIFVKGGVRSNDCLTVNVRKGDPTTLFVFLHNIMMKEFVGSQNNKKKLAQDPKGTHGHPDIQMQLGRSDIQLSQHINLKLIKGIVRLSMEKKDEYIYIK